MLRYGYNTNGCANHRLDDAIALIAAAGYDGIALTLDIHHLDPYLPDHPGARRRVAASLRQRNLGCVVETGARFLLDPTRKHEPTFVTPDMEGRARRLDFLCRALEVAAECGAEAMSFWAGVPQPGVDRAQARSWLEAGIAALLRRAEALGVTAALEPEPGMLIETVADFHAIAAALPGLRLALDVGHCVVTGEVAPERAVLNEHDHVATVSIEDMRRGVHEHLPFGEGDMDVAAVLAALRSVRCTRLVCVELSRDSHRADRMVPAALAALRAIEAGLP